MKIQWIGMLVIMVSALSASAQEATCQSDVDCPDGQYCNIAPCAAACPDGATDCTSSCPDSGTCASDAGSTSTCETDADCPTGLACQEIGGVGEACVCPEGVPCDCGEPTYTAKYACVPKACKTDAECADELVCILHEVPCANVTAPACPPDTECAEPEPAPPCEPETQGSCGPKWLGDCTVDADCGGGFTCVEAEICACSGGSGGSTEPVPASGASGGGSAPPQSAGGAGGKADDGAGGAPAEDGCSCEPSGSFYCKPDEVECTEDTDCPDGWTCGDVPDVLCTSSSDGETQCGDQASGAKGQCLPPYADLAGGGWNASGGAASAEVSKDGGAQSSPEPNGGGTAGSSDSQTTGTQSGGGSGSGSSGCTATGSGSHGALPLLLGTVALIGFIRRREV